MPAKSESFIAGGKLEGSRQNFMRAKAGQCTINCRHECLQGNEKSCHATGVCCRLTCRILRIVPETHMPCNSFSGQFACSYAAAHVEII